MIAYDDFLLNLQKEHGKKHELPSKLKFRRNLRVLSLTQSTNFVNLSFFGSRRYMTKLNFLLFLF